MRTFRLRFLPILLIAAFVLTAAMPLPAAAAGTLQLKGKVFYDDGMTVSPLGGQKVRLFVNLINWQGLGYQSWTETASAVTAGDGSYTITYSAPGAVQNARLVVIPELCRNKSAAPSSDPGFAGSAPNAGAIAFSPGLAPPSGTATYNNNNFVISGPCRVKGSQGLFFKGTVYRGYPNAPEEALGRMRVGLYIFLPQLGTWLFDSDYWTLDNGSFTLIPKYPARDFKLRTEAVTGLENTGATAPSPGIVTGFGQIEYRNYPNLVGYQSNNFYVLLGEQPVFNCVTGVNVGGEVYTDTLGMRWEADQKWQEGITLYGYTSGQVYTTTMPIAQTIEDPLYQNERFNISGYNVRVPNGTYSVTLKFAELYAYASKGARDFDVKINNVEVDSGLDPFTMAGAKYTAVDRTYTTDVAGGMIKIEFVQNKGRSTVTAIKIEKHNCTP